MTLTFAGLRPPLRAAIVAVPVLGVAVAALAATHGLAAAQPWRWALVPLCFVGTVLAERYPVKIGVEQKVSLGALPCIVAVLLLPPAVGPATAALGVAVGNVLVKRTWWETAFNAGNVLLAASAAAFLGALGAERGPAEDARALAGAAVYSVLNLTVAVLPASIHSGIPYPLLVSRAAAMAWPATLALAACAVSTSVLALEAPVIAPLPLVVLPLIFRMNVAIASQERANEQLQKVLGAQRRFLTDVSHQVATPLATIMTNLSILRRQRNVGHPEAIADSVAEAERMRRMLARLRSLAHADEDVPLRRELVDLAELTADVVRAYAAQARSSGVGLVADVRATANVNADRDLLREAVANLVDNAVRVSPPGGAVTLRVARGEHGPSIDVIDRGPGIEPERLGTLFDRFQRSDSGSGLGLAIARRVVERHGGSLHVATKQGAGSTFTIELPA
ncbi:MAG TPA: HAMP domain-containing sensor histidine kinase [Candidatus Dormibacteraeota bacterium]|nr:HAMP domain-containing sensor histidine kinase [Candidatus Dormibacteraeota bacterium]